MIKLTVICCALVLALSGQTIADPNASELQAFYNLVPDYSTVYGATSPALSPDGKCLAFYAEPGDEGVWILPGVDQFAQLRDKTGYPRPKPWKLDAKDPATATSKTRKSPSIPQRNIDWSPDGRSLAFVMGDALHIADHLDLAKKTAVLRVVAGPAGHGQGAKPKDAATGNIAVPRWSPDGARIAYIRSGPGKINVVCALEVRTGKETVLATDATDGPYVWEQPWSPDSMSIVYAEKRSDNDNLAGIRTIAATGSGVASVVSEFGGDPSWSPKQGIIAYTGMVMGTVSDMRDVAGMFGCVTTTGFSLMGCSRDGGESRRLTGVDPAAKARLADVQEAVRKRNAQVFEQRYAEQMTSEQIKRLHDGQLSASEMTLIAIIAGVRQSARKIGGEFQREIENGLDNHITSMDDLGALINRASEKLTKEQQGQKELRINVPMWAESDPNTGSLLSELQANWSPDGQRIAFVRQGTQDALNELWVLDTKTGAERLVLCSGAIKCVTWAADGKSIIAQSERYLGFKRGHETSGAPARTITWPSYSEVWLLTLK